MSKTLTLRLDSDSALTLMAIEKDTDNKTSSGAIKHLIRTYGYKTQQLEELSQEVRDLKKELMIKNQVIEEARSAALHLVEATSQSDLL